MVIKNLLEHKYYGFVVIAYVMLITWLSLVNFAEYVDDFNLNDKIGHLIAYLLFAVLVFVFLFYSKKKSFSFHHSVYISFFLASVYGVIMEFLQGVLTAYRTADVYDIIANTLGALLGVIIIILFKKIIINLKSV